MDFVTIMGLVAATLTTIAFIPQAIKIIKTKKTDDLSFLTYLMMSIGLTLWLIYGIVINNLPLIVANSITVPLNYFILYYIILNERKKNEEFQGGR